MLDTGEAAPSFDLENQAGDVVSLADYRGQWVVVYFYPRADTPGCTTEACEFRDNWDAFSDHDIAVIGISDDPVADLESFADSYDLPFELCSDPDGSVASAYESYGEKNVFGNVVEGVFRNTYVVDPDGEIAATFEGVSPEGHAEEVLATIR